MTEYQKMQNGMIYDTQDKEPDRCKSTATAFVSNTIAWAWMTKGSVVTRDISEGVPAAGNPARVIRKITEQDSMYRKVKRD